MGAVRASGAIDDAVALRVAIARIYRLLRGRIASDLTQSQLSALARVEQSAPLRLGELAELEGVAAATMSRIVDALSSAGLLRRSPDASDGRASAIELTSAGDDVLGRARSSSADALREALRSLPAVDRDAINRALPALERLGAKLS